MNHINELRVEAVKLIAFDVDGVLVRRGTKIKSTRDYLELNIKHIAPKQIHQMRELHELGFLLNITSGRGLYMLQLMFREVLPFVSLTYENGSATWLDGEIIQHVNSYVALENVYDKLSLVCDDNIKGWEPKEFIITIHCEDEVPKIPEIVSLYDDLYCIWNGEAYDIGVKGVQTKAFGLNDLAKFLNININGVLAIGDNYNDKELLDAAGISVTADKDRVYGDYWVPLDAERLPADILMDTIIRKVRAL